MNLSCMDELDIESGEVLLIGFKTTQHITLTPRDLWRFVENLTWYESREYEIVF